MQVAVIMAGGPESPSGRQSWDCLAPRASRSSVSWPKPSLLGAMSELIRGGVRA